MTSRESARQSTSAEQPASPSESPKRARGRPRKPQKEPATGEPSPKRPRGRPKGSKNKGPSKSAQKKEEGSGEKRPRGRPRKWKSEDGKTRAVEVIKTLHQAKMALGTQRQLKESKEGSPLSGDLFCNSQREIHNKKKNLVRKKLKRPPHMNLKRTRQPPT